VNEKAFRRSSLLESQDLLGDAAIRE
jgi:hypothetical protein